MRIAWLCAFELTMEEILIGICQLQLNRLLFVTGWEPIEDALTKLVEVFRLSFNTESHPLPVMIPLEEL